jgi:hypothetical protein
MQELTWMLGAMAVESHLQGCQPHPYKPVPVRLRPAAHFRGIHVFKTDEDIAAFVAYIVCTFLDGIGIAWLISFALST